MKIIEKGTKAGKRDRVVWEVYLTSDKKLAQFTPCKAFETLTREQVLKVLQKAEPGVTSETEQGYVNFKFSINGRCAGFLNFYDNELESESTDEEVSSVLTELTRKLDALILEDVRKPLTSDEAISMVDEL